MSDANFVSHLDQLSVDIVTLIFEHTVAGSAPDRALARSVCKNWRAIIDSAPSCSRDVSFHITLWSGGLPDSIRLQRLLEACFTSIDRARLHPWILAYVLGMHTIHSHHVCRRTQFRERLLDVIALAKTSIDGDAPTTYLTPIMLESLPREHLISTMELFTHRKPHEIGASLKLFLLILVSFPQLEQLTVALTDIIDDPPPTSVPLTLPFLNRLYLTSSQPPFESTWNCPWRTSTLWSYIVTPGLKELSVPQRWFEMSSVVELSEFFRRNSRIPAVIQFVECPVELVIRWRRRHQDAWPFSLVQLTCGIPRWMGDCFFLSHHDSFDCTAAAKIIADHFSILPTELERFLEAVAACNRWLADPANSHFVSEKRGVVQWAWGTELHAALGNSTRDVIGLVFLPLILADILLHVSNPNPAPTVPRAPSRVTTLKKLSETSATRLPAKKADLLGFWRGLKLANPLLTVLRNLTHVSLVISLYLLGDVNLSQDAREQCLLLSASTLGVTLTAAEAKAAVADTDIALMMAPVYVAVAHSPLALLCPTSYVTAQFTSRVVLLDTWRALGNIHRIDPSDPLGMLESILWRLLFRLARKEIIEAQLLHYFYEDAFVSQTLEALNKGAPLPAAGHGLKYAADDLENATETIDLTEELERLESPVVPVAPVVEKEASVKPPPRKKQKTDSGAAVGDSGSSRTLRPRSVAAGPSSQVAPAPSASSTKAPKAKAKKSVPKKSSRLVVESESEDSDSDGAKDINPPVSYTNLQMLAVSDGWRLPLLREADSMLQTCEDDNRILDPTLLYDVASEDFTVDIDYWVFSPAPTDVSAPLVASKHQYQYRPFHETRSDAEYLRKIVASQPVKRCEVSNRDLPLHIHPDAQIFRRSGGLVSETGVPLLPDVVPSCTDSIVYVVHEDTWKSMTALQHQEVLRTRAVLVVHRSPYLHDGKALQFDEEGLAALTHLDRLAFFQDLGARRNGKGVDLQVGRVRDLLVCSRQTVESDIMGAATTKDVDEAPLNQGNELTANEDSRSDESTAPKATGAPTQRLNLLGNTLQSTSLAMPLGWTDLATHEYACTWLEHLHRVPAFVFPWSEVTWSIAANAHAVTWIHTDVLFTVVDIAVGEKLWYLASRRTDLPLNDFRGIMRSRAAFDTFNGWTDMTSVWHFEQVHLSPYTTLYMPATLPHAVISLTNCIGVGRHGIPVSNLSHCVYVSLHNTVLAKSTTNADHEPARRFLVRIFIFTMLAFIEPRDGSGGRGREDNGRPRLAARTTAHIPNLSTNDGVLDLLALRSFVVLVVALNSSSYEHAVERNGSNLLPLETEAARELSLAWKLAHDVVQYVSHTFTFKRSATSVQSFSDIRAPTSFSDAANLSLITMAVSMRRYLSDAPKKALPPGFSCKTFEQQARRMLVLFELHKGLDESQRITQLFANPDAQYKGSDVSPSAEFSRLVADRTKNFFLLQPWDSSSLPFTLVPN
ncbi:hypothetical protein B0H12DRAFT_1080157 [Mycena haematopus]|nr:hypothetical protein B0H12DRAFT_1080157 [Mycena haematopus]